MEQVARRAAQLSPARVWWLAARPATLAASISPVLAGTAAAVHAGHPRLLPGLLAVAVGLAMQVGVNYANDYSDFKRGADTPRRRGPVRAAASGVVRPEHVKLAAFAAFGTAAAAGLVLSLLTDWRLLLAGAAAVAAGWLYTGGPRPYGYLGLGEIFVFVFFGLMATLGTTYVEIGRVTGLAAAGAVSMGCLACAILVLNNLRDIQTDREAGKLTLAVRLGRAGTRGLLLGLLAAAFMPPLAVVAVGEARWPVLLPLVAGALAVPIYRMSASSEARTLVSALKRCAELEVWFALLWTVGVLAA